MPRIVDIAAFVHSFRVGGYDVSRMRPPSIVVGDPKAGEAYFKTARAGRGGFGGPAAASNVPPATVTVTPASGPKVEGRLVRIDDFIVTLTLADGMPRTFRGGTARRRRWRFTIRSSRTKTYCGVIRTRTFIT